ncbi:MAG: carboxymuconolactone decarboxylase family protein [Chloroflexi bacterium]|nr:carboxymuconolactone decarboxylase family protein [Chloroflexota bacterium]
MTKEQQDYIQRIYQNRGYVLDFHKVMVAEDFEWVKLYDPFVRYTYTGQRTLDRKTKELLQIVALAAKQAGAEHIKLHVKEALTAGATKQEILEALQCVVMVLGGVSFNMGIQAWAEGVGASRVEPKTG